jgi:ADP-heptose:LPS heptosyltransferase
MSRVQAVRRLAAVRALPGVGDLLCAVPALRALRAAHPGALITLVGLPSARWFVPRYPGLVDDLLEVTGVPGLPECRADAGAARRFYARARRRRFDLAVQLHGSGGTTNPLTTMLAARDQVTAHLPGHWVPPGRTILYPAEGPEVHRLLAVTRAAGCPDQGDRVELPTTPSERARAAALVAAGPAEVPAPYACLHPGASRPANRWPAARFAAVGARLAAAGQRVVLTGTAPEAGMVAEVAAALPGRCLDLCGRTGMGVLAAVFAGARLVVSNDTGAAHVAAAVGAPSVVVFPAEGDPQRWAPLDRTRHRAFTPGPRERWPPVDAVLEAAAGQLVGTAVAP